jgi:hypothetical protein
MTIEYGDNDREFATKPRTSGKYGIKRSTIPTTMATVTVPDQVNEAILQNIGTTNIVFNFDGDTTDYWTLLPTEKVQFRIRGGDELHIQSIGSTGQVQAMYWGD